jgi:MFS family permease
MARIIKWIKATFPSDVLDDGPQLVVSVGVGALFGAWVTTKGTEQPIDWVWGWPLVFIVLVVFGVALWIVRGKFTDRVKRVKADRDAVRDTKIHEMHANVSEMKQMLMTRTPQTASGIAETTATEYVNPGIPMANVTARASVHFGGTKPEKKDDENEPEEDSGA